MRDQEEAMRIDYLQAPTWGGGGIGPRRGVKKLPRQSSLCAFPSTHECFSQSE